MHSPSCLPDKSAARSQRLLLAAVLLLIAAGTFANAWVGTAVAAPSNAAPTRPASAPASTSAAHRAAASAAAVPREAAGKATAVLPMRKATPTSATAPPAAPMQRTSLKDTHAENLGLAAWCGRLAERLASLAPQQCRETALVPGDGRSVNGVPLWFRDIAPAHAPERLRVLVLGGIHGDEMASVSLVFDWISRSLKLNDEPIHWRMVPLVNPDGLLHQPSRRMNAHGVDLNRNFSTPDWDVQANKYWVGRTGKDPRRFPGPTAMSEPETRWIQKQIELFKPNLIVSVHAPFGVLDFDGPPPVPGKLGSLYLDQVGIYPGSLGNYGGVVLQVPVVTIELKNARQVAVAEVGAMWSDLLEWIDRRLINVAQDASGDRKVR
jgi:hypothetical protein